MNAEEVLTSLQGSPATTPPPIGGASTTPLPGTGAPISAPPALPGSGPQPIAPAIPASWYQPGYVLDRVFEMSKVDSVAAVEMWHEYKRLTHQ